MQKMDVFKIPSPLGLFRKFDKVHKGNLWDDYLADKDGEGFIKTLIYEWAPIWMDSDDYDFKAVFELIQGLYLLDNDKALYDKLNYNYIIMTRFTCKEEYDYLMCNGIIDKNFRDKENKSINVYKCFCGKAKLDNLLFGWWNESSLDGKCKIEKSNSYKITYKIPRDKCYTMSYSNWSALVFNFIDSKTTEEAGEFKNNSLAQLLAGTALINRNDYIQICVQELKKEWITSVEEVNYTII